MVNETRIGGTIGFCSNATIKTNSLLTAHSAPPPKVLQTGNSVQESILPKQNLVNNQISSIVSKKLEADQPKEVKNSTLKVSPTLTPLNKVPKNSETKRDRNEASNSNATTVHQNRKGGAAQINIKIKSTEGSNQAEPQRPVNPFAKSSSSKEQSSSLLDSIKKMKAENEKVDKYNTKKVKV
jgi:chromosome transmission fidelity protein 4